jgi:hypothetical protein
MRGATIIAPITVAAEFESRPKVAMTVLSRVRTK